MHFGVTPSVTENGTASGFQIFVCGVGKFQKNL